MLRRGARARFLLILLMPPRCCRYAYAAAYAYFMLHYVAMPPFDAATLMPRHADAMLRLRCRAFTPITRYAAMPITPYVCLREGL